MTEPLVASVQRVLPAPPQVVYAEWLDAEGMRDWMCPRPAVPTAIELDPRVGGRLRIDIDDDGVLLTVTGRYLELDPPYRIQFSWNCTTWDPPAPDSIVTVLLEPFGDDETLMTINHAQLPPDLVERHQNGWGRIAVQVEAALC